MKIRFGLHLDGERGWRAADRLGEAVLGPLGLLGMLETQLGFAGDWPSHAERVLQYRASLTQPGSSKRFYQASFAADELGATARLLEWRDTWHLHGWDGTIRKGASSRLLDLAEVEKHAAGNLALTTSIGERLKRAADALAARSAAIDGVELIDPLGAFPKRWRDVLSRLPVKQAGSIQPCDHKTLLGRLQRALCQVEAGAKVDKIAWHDDGTVRVIQAETCLAAGRWIADVVRDGDSDIALIAAREGDLLDAVLSASDVPRHGLESASSFRPALQVLPLTLRTLWEPLDVYALLKFLTHSVCPVPRFARRILAEELAQRPGIGGSGWAEALETIAERDAESAESVRNAILFWVEHKRFDPEVGAPLPLVIERVRRLMEYFGARLGTADSAEEAGFAAGYAQVAAFVAGLEALSHQGEKIIRPRQLQTLVSHATGQGSKNPNAFAEAGCLPAVSNPGALIEPFERVVWWQLGAVTTPRRYPWSEREIGELAQTGVELPSLDRVLADRAREWIRPILAARKEVTLVLPPRGEEVHPVWLAIESLVGGIPIRPVETVIAGEKGNDRLAKVPIQPLPQRKRWWILPQEVPVGRRKEESYSSLNLFLNNPYQWVLQYQARLRPSNILSVRSDYLLYGNLGHRLVERFYGSSEAIAMQGRKLERWFDTTFPRIVQEEGAVLLMRGRGGDLESLRARLKRALVELQRQLEAAHVKVVEPEKELAGKFVGGGLAGIADLLVRREKGEPAIVDMKWSGVTAYRDRLAEGGHLQLALYGELVRQEGGAWPSVAYFILNQPLLMATTSDYFPEARAVQSPDAETTAHLWQRFLESWKWRRDQINTGRIEVVLEGVEETEESIPPEDGLEVETLNPDYNNYLQLAGWEG